jgi:hypothetical protein
MEVFIRKISKSEFKGLDIPVLFEDELLDRTFGVASDGKNQYKLGWQSELITPVLTYISALHCSIGIDLNFAIFEFATGKILQKLSLDYYFFDTQIFNDALYIITQLEIIKIDIADLVIIETYSLPDFFDSIEFNHGVVAVKCIDNEVIILH